MVRGQIGDKIEKLTVLDRKQKNNHTYCYCQCDCGNKKWVRADTLGRVKSCGCLSKSTQFKAKDIINKRFGRLIAIKPTNKRDIYNGSVIWECKCDCGNVCKAPEYELNNGTVQSCGCLLKESRKKNISKAIEKHLKDHIVNKVNVPAIERIELLSNNTSGVKGVHWDKNRHKWVAQIDFQGKHYSLGRYSEKEDAIKVRKKAEEKYHKNFLEWYRNEYKKINGGNNESI